MAYSDFTFQKLKAKFGIEVKSIHFFKTLVATVEPSQHLLADLETGREMPLYSEKAKSEALIFPIIREIKRANKGIAIFSGYTFNIDSNSELTGAPDFLISAKPDIIEPSCPVFCLMESKNKTPDEGFAQCAAEMYAARLFNQQAGEPYETIYGAVTNAFEWVFLKLEGNTV
ncbi:MAG: hypothetical protein RI894_1234 [Bacteroidota bacterium]